eukprot:248561-Ditylum_brightwellii.AAC.1
MENTSGHGTDETVDWYVILLKNKYNVKIIHQILHSPETNILDLDIWMAIQSIAERFHAGKVQEKDVLAQAVEFAWGTLDPIKLSNLIIDNGRGNDKVQSNWGKLFSIPCEEDDSGDDLLEADAVDLELV